MGKFSKMGVGARLGAGFGAVLMFILVVAGADHYSQVKVAEWTDHITEIDFVGTEIIYQTIATNQEGSNWIDNLLEVKDVEEIKRQIAARASRSSASNDRFKKLEELDLGPRGKEAVADLLQARKGYTPVRLGTLDLLSKGKRDEARELWNTKGTAELKNYREKLDKGLQYFKMKVDESRAGIAAANRMANIVALCATLAALLVGVVIAWRTSRWLRAQLGGEPADASEMANRIAAGDLSKEVVLRAGDAGSVMKSMATMQEVIRQYVKAQEEMKVRHDSGAISFRIDEQRFSGSYADMARMSNELVASHIAVKMRLVEVMDCYAKGDLSCDMDRLPGEKAKLTEVMDGVKASLKGLSAQIQTLVDAAGRGDFTERGDESRFDHEFRRMVAGLNQLMQTSETGLAEVSRVLGALARGDLTETITNDYQGTIGRLKDDANQTVENLTVIVRQIKEASETINTASVEISQGNTDLSQRTEEQASSLEETASSMEELTGTVKQNAENARQANQLAVGASDVAVKGGEVVKQVVSTMNGISESSKKIADIIGTIDGIAFQTNILALNAAVEAARAGEQGRGFAVVATEVRNLAQRSAAAAKEIKELISDSVGKVDAGSQLVDEAGRTMDDVVVSVKRVTDIIGEITAASQEQSSGIEQVNRAITQMDEVTQQNAALVEEAAAAAESMQEQAVALVQSVATFRLDGAVQTAAAPAAERRGPNRAKNVARIRSKAVAMDGHTTSAPATEGRRAAAGGSDEWTEF